MTQSNRAQQGALNDEAADRPTPIPRPPIEDPPEPGPDSPEPHDPDTIPDGPDPSPVDL